MTLIQCVGRRRIVVEPTGDTVTLHIWFRDPPSGKRVASLVLTKEEFAKFLLRLTEVTLTT